MIESVEDYGNKMIVYTDNGLIYNGKRDVIENVFDKELKRWHSTKKKKRS